MSLSFSHLLAPRWLPKFITLSHHVPFVDDFSAIFERDPAATNWLEVLLCYPGLHAIALHRLAHWLHRNRIKFLPRFISHVSRCLTGIEIHPGAQLGRGVVIDHGMGVVIGETAVIGSHTLIYQGVTLGGTGKETGKRHPTVGRNVVVGAGARILGNIQIGDFSRIGAGSIVLKNVPAHCTAVGVPSRNVCRCNTVKTPLEHGQLPDATAIAVQALCDRIAALETQLTSLQSTYQSDPSVPASPQCGCPSFGNEDCDHSLSVDLVSLH